MAIDKDFKVKNGLVVQDNLVVGATTVVSSEKVLIRSDSAGASTVALRLQNAGTTAGTGVQLSFVTNTSSGGPGNLAIIQAIATNTSNGSFLTFSTSGNTERMRIDATGNVGIGIDPAADNYKLNLFGNAIKYGDGAYTGYIGKASLIVVGGGVSDFAVRSDTNLLFSTGNLEVMRINTSGNVGIGTTGPSAKLDVVDAASPYVLVRSTGANPVQTYLQASTAVQIGVTGTLNNYPFALYVNSTERLRISPAGGFSFGTSGTNFGTSGQVLVSAGNAPPVWTAPGAVSTFTGGVVSGATSFTAAGPNPQLTLAGATSNIIEIGQAGVAPPTITTARSIGTKLILNNAFANGSTTDYALGIDANTFWQSVPAATSGSSFKWYGGATQLMQLNGAGDLGIGIASVSAFGHGGTNKLMQIHNAGTTANSQAHIIISSGIGSITSSSIGSITWALPAASTAGLGKVAHIGALTDATHTNTTPAAFLAFSTKSISDITAIEKMRIDSVGNVGIGTTPSPWGLNSILKVIDISGAGTVRGSNTGVSLNCNSYYDGAVFKAKTTNPGGEFSVDVGIHYWFNAASVAAGATQTMTERMRLDLTGNLGIGGIPSGARLDVYGAVKVRDNDFINLSAVGGEFRIGWAAFTGTQVWNIFAQNSQALAFGTAGTERMRITAGGDLILQSSVAQKSGGGSWAATSDKRVKDSIQNYTKGTAELMQVRVCEWEYNGKAGTTAGMKGIGVIADEVMSVLPATVDTYQAKLNAEDAEPTTIKRFDSSEITWLLVKTVQEQQATIAALTARMAVLEAK